MSNSRTMVIFQMSRGVAISYRSGTNDGGSSGCICGVDRWSLGSG